MVIMGVNTPRDKMVRSNKRGNIVDEDIFLMCEIIRAPVNLKCSYFSKLHH